MKSFIIKDVRGVDKTIQLDDSKTYYDYYIEDRKGSLVAMNFELMLSMLSKSEVSLQEVLEEILILARYVTDAPRKRILRQMRKDGITVMTNEQLFDAPGRWDEGSEIINSLENSGKYAAYLLGELG